MRTTTLKTDPEIKAFIPPLTNDERTGLEADIKRDGCRDALVIWKGHNVILDGHNRQEICDRLGIGYRTVAMEFETRNDAMLWVLDNQNHRRNLSDYQRVQLALKRETVIADMASERMKSGVKASAEDDPMQNSAQGSRPGSTREKVAELAGVSHDTVTKVKKIEADAADPLKAMVSADEVSIDAAAKVATLPKSEQRKVVAKGPDAVKEAARKIREAKKSAAESKEPDKAKPETPDESDEPQIVRDATGREVTDPALIEVFSAATDRFKRAMNLLTAFAKEISPLTGGNEPDSACSGGEMLASNKTQVRADYKNLRSALSAAMPYAICPFEHKKNVPCPVCKGLGWVVKSIYDRAPEELKYKGGAE